MHIKIYPVVFAFEKDADFIWLQRKFIKKIGAPLEEHTLFVDKSFAPSPIYSEFIEREGIRLIERLPGFYPWPSWEHCLCKVAAYRSFLELVKPEDDDYVVDMDSDAFLVGMGIINYLGKADFIGFHFNDRLRWVDRFKKQWAHIFGAFMAMRVKALKQAVSLPESDWAWIRNYLETTPGSQLVNDHFVALMMEVAGATSFYPDHGRLFAEGRGIEPHLLKGGDGWSVLHLYGHWSEFGGHKISDKYAIPSILRKLGVV